MRQALATVGVVVAALTAATLVQGQVSPPRRLVGQGISSGFRGDGRVQTTTPTVTLTFVGNDGGPVLTVDFMTRYSGLGPPTAPPSVVDVVVTQHPSDEDAPEMTMRVNGEALPLVARLYSRRSVAATISFDEFLRLTNGETIVEQAFGSELEFSDLQIRVLRAEAKRWSGR